MRTLKDLGKIVTGNTPKMSERENFDSADIPFIKPGDISDDSITVINKGQFFISENARDKARILPSDSILVTCIGIIGKVGILTREAAFNQQINGIVPDINSVIPRYLAYAILSQKSYLQEKANAAVVPIINKSQFSELKVEVPNLQKQNEIVRNLDKVDHLISLQKQQLKGLDELVKSRFLEMFGDIELNSQNMQKMMWQEVFDTQTGKLDANAAVKGGRYPFFTCAKEISTIDEYAYDCEALLLAGNNAVGDYDVKYYKGKFNAYQRTYILMLKNRQYSYSVFKFQLEQKLRYLQLQSKGTNTRYLTMGILKSLDFIVPPIVKQQEFAQFVNATDKSKLAVQKSLDELETLKKSLMQTYFG